METNQQIYRGDRDRHQHHREAHAQVARKGDRMPMLGRDAREHHVCRSADQRAVAAQARAQGQRPPQRGDIHAVRLHRKDQRDHGGDKRDVVEYGREHRRAPQDEQHEQHGVAAGHLDQRIAQHGDDAGLLHAADHDEQAGEEQNGRPLDAEHDLFGVLLADQQHYCSTAQCDNARIHAERAVEHKAEHDHNDHHNALDQQRVVLDRLVFIQLHDSGHLVRLDDELFAEHEIEAHAQRCHDKHHCDTGIAHEVHEAQARLRTDHDIRRVADQSRRTADVGGEDLRQQEGHRVNAQNAGDRDRHRAHQQHGRHVIQERREHRGQDGEQQHDLPGVALCDLG